MIETVCETSPFWCRDGHLLFIAWGLALAFLFVIPAIVAAVVTFDGGYKPGLLLGFASGWVGLIGLLVLLIVPELGLLVLTILVAVALGMGIAVIFDSYQIRR